MRGYPGYIQPVKVLISLDPGLVQRIDRKARSRGLSRSAYLAELAQRDIADQNVSVKSAMQQLDRIFARVPAGDSTAEIRAERDAR